MTTAGWVALAVLSLCGAAGTGAARVRRLGARRRLVEVGTSSRRMPCVPVARVAFPLAVVATALAGVRFGAALGCAVGAVLGIGLLLAFDAMAGRRERQRRQGLLNALRVLVAELEAGATQSVALAGAAELSPDHGPVLRAAAECAAAGGDAGGVLAADPHTRAAGLAWSLGQDTGAALAAVLGRVAADLSAADDQRRAVGVALSGPRSSAVVLAGLPVVGIALGVSMGAAPLAFLAGSPSGRVTCCVGVLLDALGVLWMRRILRSAQQV